MKDFDLGGGQDLLPRPPWLVGERRWDFQRPLIMGVLNATPDSFSDGGEYITVEAAVARAGELVEQGADIIDLGGASSHPHARPVSLEEELGRVRPIVERLVKEVHLPLSIDTQKPEVAELCLELGVHLINDVSGRPGEEMARLAARHGVPHVIMFNNFTVPRDPAVPLLQAMLEFFRERIALASAAGQSRIILDPGYGFGKTLEENMELLRALSRLHELRRPLLVCTSRKGSLGKIVNEVNPRKRLGATLAASLFAVQQGVHMVRVHDVKEFRQTMRTWLAIGRPG